MADEPVLPPSRKELHLRMATDLYEEIRRLAYVNRTNMQVEAVRALRRALFPKESK